MKINNYEPKTLNPTSALVPLDSCDVVSLSSNDIALAGQTFSQGLEQSRGQSSGSNSANMVFKQKLTDCT